MNQSHATNDPSFASRVRVKTTESRPEHWLTLTPWTVCNYRSDLRTSRIWKWFRRESQILKSKNILPVTAAKKWSIIAKMVKTLWWKKGRYNRNVCNSFRNCTDRSSQRTWATLWPSRVRGLTWATCKNVTIGPIMRCLALVVSAVNYRLIDLDCMDQLTCTIIMDRMNRQWLWSMTTKRWNSMTGRKMERTPQASSQSIPFSHSNRYNSRLLRSRMSYSRMVSC